VTAENKQEQPAKACCTPSRETSLPGKDSYAGPHSIRNTHGCVEIPGGRACMGTNDPQLLDDGEGPFRKLKLKSFLIGATVVTNQEFSDFVENTGYVTEAEKFGWSFVFKSDIPDGLHQAQFAEGADWWRRVDGANWREINGPDTHERAWFPDHPVVQVSWNDANAYAGYVGGRLPTEAEWEHAARGGQLDVRYPWGNEDPNDSDTFPCNIWQGRFPDNNTAADGWRTTAPACSFDPNAYGLYNLSGNVWEWTNNHYGVKSLKKHIRKRMESMRGFKTLKGGSFLCHRSYCFRYRIAARTGNSPDSATTHQGFRVVWDLE